jgi:hypothetical protein
LTAAPLLSIPRINMPGIRLLFQRLSGHRRFRVKAYFRIAAKPKLPESNESDRPMRKCCGGRLRNRPEFT